MAALSEVEATLVLERVLAEAMELKSLDQAGSLLHRAKAATTDLCKARVAWGELLAQHRVVSASGSSMVWADRKTSEVDATSSCSRDKVREQLEQRGLNSEPYRPRQGRSLSDREASAAAAEEDWDQREQAPGEETSLREGESEAPSDDW